MKWSDVQPWIGPIIAVIGLIAGFFYFRAGRTRKTLDWVEISNTPLVTSSASALTGLEVRYDGEAVKQPRIVVIRIRNTGTVELTSADYHKLPTFVWNKCRMLTFDIIRESTPGIVADEYIWRDEGPAFAICPVLLNGGDWFDLQFVVDGPREWPEFTARIKGQTRPPQKASGPPQSRRQWLAFALGLGTSLVLALAVQALPTHSVEPLAALGFAVAAAALTLVAYILFQADKSG